MKKGYRPGGGRIKRPDSKALATSKKVTIQHAAGSRALLKEPLDLRSTVGRAYFAHKQALAAHLGGEPSVAQAALIDQAARFAVLTRIAWGEVHRTGVLDSKTGQLTGATEALLRASKEERAVLQLLGLERKSRELSLHEILQQPQHDSDDES